MILWRATASLSGRWWTRRYLLLARKWIGAERCPSFLRHPMKQFSVDPKPDLKTPV